MEVLVEMEKVENSFKVIGLEPLDEGALERDAVTSEEEEGDSLLEEEEEVGRRLAQIGGSEEKKRLIIVDGNNLMLEDLVDCAQDKCELQLAESARGRIVEARKFLEKVATEHRIIYGITTGFGTFANVEICSEDLKQLQLNLIRSHATGYGDPLEPAKARMLLALRINVLAKGHSGISLENLDKLIKAFNAFCVSFVPEQGTVGCSGDLCPLAHLALGLLGEGQMWSPSTGWKEAGDVLKANGLEPMELGY